MNKRIKTLLTNCPQRVDVFFYTDVFYLTNSCIPVRRSQCDLRRNWVQGPNRIYKSSDRGRNVMEENREEKRKIFVKNIKVFIMIINSKILNHYKSLHRYLQRVLLTLTDLGRVSLNMFLHYNLLISLNHSEPFQ